MANQHYLWLQNWKPCILKVSQDRKEPNERGRYPAHLYLVSGLWDIYITMVVSKSPDDAKCNAGINNSSALHSLRLVHIIDAGTSVASWVLESQSPASWAVFPASKQSDCWILNIENSMWLEKNTFYEAFDARSTISCCEPMLYFSKLFPPWYSFFLDWPG